MALLWRVEQRQGLEMQQPSRQCFLWASWQRGQWFINSALLKNDQAGDGNNGRETHKAVTSKPQRQCYFQAT